MRLSDSHPRGASPINGCTPAKCDENSRLDCVAVIADHAVKGARKDMRLIENLELNRWTAVRGPAVALWACPVLL